MSRVLLAVAALAAVASPGLGAAAEAPSSEEILRRAGQVLEHPSYQTELPGHDAAADAARPGGGEITPPRSRRAVLPLSLAAGPVIRALLWVLVAAAVAAAVAWLLREADRSRLRQTRLAKPETPPAGDEPRIPAPPELDEVEELARRGAYGEAAHLLLRRAIALVGRRRPLAPSLTSREVVRCAGLAGAARGAFEELVAAVERFWFGGARLRREDYERCAAAYRTVAGAGADGAAEDGR